MLIEQNIPTVFEQPFETFLGLLVFFGIVLILALIPWLIILGIGKLYKRVNIVLISPWICLLFVIIIFLIKEFLIDPIRYYCFYNVSGSDFSDKLMARECLKTTQGRVLLTLGHYFSFLVIKFR